MTKPKDMLEFFRRSAPADSHAAPSSPALEPTTRMLVLRRSQAVVAGCAAAAALLLAFLVGHAVGASGSGEIAGPEVYVIRAISYADDEKGKGFARTMKELLEQMDLGEEVGVVHVPSQGRTVVTVGSWLSSPAARKEARALLEKLHGLKDKKQAMPFADAEFWRMER